MTCAVLITPLVDVVPIIEGCDYIGVDERCAQHPAELRHGPSAEQLVRLAEIDQPEDAVLLPVERCESCVGLAAIEILFPLFQKWNIVRQVCIERVDVCAVKIIERRQFSEKTEAGGAARLDQADRAVRTLAQRGTDARLNFPEVERG